MEPIYRLCEACLGIGIKTSTYKKVQKVEDCEFCDGTGKFPAAYFIMNGDPRKLSIQLNDLPELEQRIILQGSHGIKEGDVVNNVLIGRQNFDGNKSIGLNAGKKINVIEEHTEGEFTLKKNTLTKDSDIEIPTFISQLCNLLFGSKIIYKK